MYPSFLFKTVSRDSPMYDFLTTHDDARHNGFITRLDRTPASRKRSLFYRSLALNVSLATGLAVLSFLSIQNILESRHPPSTRLAWGLSQGVLLATANSVILRTTLLPFLIGECCLRYLTGFRETEIVLRRCPGYIKSGNLRQPLSERRGVNGDTTPKLGLSALRRRVERLTDVNLLYSRPGALLSNEYWTLEYSALIDANKRVAQGQLSELDFELSVWKREQGLWTACELWRSQDILSEEQESHAFQSLCMPYKH